MGVGDVADDAVFAGQEKRDQVVGQRDGQDDDAHKYRHLGDPEGRCILSLADIQWVIHNAPDSGTLEFTIRRSGEFVKKNVLLAAGWRRRSDISWRTSTWSLRRMAFGGMVLEANPGATSMSLTAKHVGQYGEHALAKRAGLVKGDRITSFNGITEPLTETLLLHRILSETKPGDRVKVTAVRNGTEREFTIRLP